MNGGRTGGLLMLCSWTPHCSEKLLLEFASREVGTILTKSSRAAPPRGGHAVAEYPVGDILVGKGSAIGGSIAGVGYMAQT